MMKKKIKTGKVEKLTAKSAETPVESVAPPVPVEPPAPPKVNPQDFAFPVGSSFEMDDRMYRVLRAYVNDNVETREVASEGEVTVMMLKSLRKEAASARSFILFS